MPGEPPLPSPTAGIRKSGFWTTTSVCAISCGGWTPTGPSRERTCGSPGDEYIARRGVGPGDEGWTDYDEFSTSDRRPAADVFPAVSGVQVRVDGSVWVYRYRRPGESEQPRLMGFGPDGEFVCHLPPEKDDYTIREFGADYVLGVHEDELGIHRVAMYDLERLAATP